MIRDQEITHFGKTYLWIYEEDTPGPDLCWRWAEKGTYMVPRAQLSGELCHIFVRDKMPSMVLELERNEYQRFAGILRWMGVRSQHVRSMNTNGLPLPNQEALAGFVSIHQLIHSRSSHYSVYVIRLRPEVRGDRFVCTINPNSISTMPCVYVGMTGLSVGERLERHLEGTQSSRYVRAYGLELLPHLYSGLNAMENGEAMLVEAALAEELRRQGYTVTGGH